MDSRLQGCELSYFNYDVGLDFISMMTSKVIQDLFEFINVWYHQTKAGVDRNTFEYRKFNTTLNPYLHITTYNFVESNRNCILCLH